MNATEPIPFSILAIGLLPVVIVIATMVRWSQSVTEPLIGIVRMVIQLMLIGLVLTYIFKSENLLIVLLVCCVMVSAAAWIALRTIPRTMDHYICALAAIMFGGGLPLGIVVAFILKTDPWYAPKTIIPLAGMVFANGMNAVSLAAERFQSESRQPDISWQQARGTALRTAMIPITNGFLSVGLVSIPGFMTGQILNGAEPIVAARAQMMIMCMIYSAVGLSTIGYLALTTRRMEE